MNKLKLHNLNKKNNKIKKLMNINKKKMDNKL